MISPNAKLSERKEGDWVKKFGGVSFFLGDRIPGEFPVSGHYLPRIRRSFLSDSLVSFFPGRIATNSKAHWIQELRIAAG